MILPFGIKNLVISAVLLLLFASCSSKSGDNLIKAVKNNDFEKVKRITTQENVSFIDGKGATPMMWAAFNGNVEILDFLIKNGADARKKGVLSVKRKNAYGKDVIISYPSPLNAAAGEGHIEAVKYLIEKAGVSPNEKTIKVKDSIDAKGNPSFFDEEENDKSALIEAVLSHKKDVAAYLLSKGADPDYTEYDPEITALEVAFLTFDYEMAELLLKNGASADIFTRRSDGFRVYPFFAVVPKECVPPETDKAAYNQSLKEIIPLLLKNGATLQNFIFPVSKMCGCKNQEMVEFMISIGFDPEWQFNDTSIGDYCRNQGIEISEEMIINSTALEETRKDEELKQNLLLQIIRHQTRNNSRDGTCTTIKISTEYFPDMARKKRAEENKRDTSSIGAKISRVASIEANIERTIGDVPEVGKNGNIAKTVGNFFSGNKGPMIIQGLEKYSCKKDGFTSDAECYRQIDGQMIRASKECMEPSWERPEITFSTPYLDPATNQVFVYEHWYCGPLCARSSLLVYELKSNGELEYKYGRTLRVS
ncbi:ankyrin repeat domain-containing protein [bacterium]|nr:ankyrin repeat domain-containing protein [bacterium]